MKAKAEGIKAEDMTPVTLSEALVGRVGSRTVYRWAKGESAPQRRADLVALEHLAETARLSKTE